MLNQTDKHVLTTIYSCGISGSDPIKVMSKTLLPSEIKARLDRLSRKKLIAGTSLTKAGRESIRVVLAGGVFDIIHPGHVHTLAAAKALGDVLVVVVATDSTARRMKKKTPRHAEEERQNLTRLLEMVDVCVVGQQDIFQTVMNIKPDMIALGYDQTHHERYIKDGCSNIGVDVQVIRLSSTMPDISSSKIQKEGNVMNDL